MTVSEANAYASHVAILAREQRAYQDSRKLCPGTRVSTYGKLGTIVRHEGQNGADYYVVSLDGIARSRPFVRHEMKVIS